MPTDPTAILVQQVAELSRALSILMVEQRRLTKRNERLRLLAHRCEARRREAQTELERRANPGPSISRKDLALVIRGLSALKVDRADKLATKLYMSFWGD